MTMSEPEEANQSKRERKRKCDSSSPRKKRTKEDEKENLTVASSPSSSDASISLSGISRESSSNHELAGASRRKNYKPKKKKDLELTMECSEPDELLDKLRKFGASRQPLFLVRNVIQKKKLIAHQSSPIFREVDKTLPACIIKISKNWKVENHLWFELDISRIMSWANSMEAVNEINATSKVDLYMVFLSKSGTPLFLSQGFSIVPLHEHGGGGVKGMFTKKKIAFRKDRIGHVTHVYVAAVVSKMAPVVDQSNKRRSVRAVANPTSIQYEKVTRFGAFLLYDKNKNIDTLDNGIKTMVLVDRDDNPNFDLDTEDKEKLEEWFKKSGNLDLIHLRNSHKENSHLPRLIFTTELTREDEDEDENKEEDEETAETVECLPATQEPRQDENATTSTSQMDQDEDDDSDNDGTNCTKPRCPFRGDYFDCAEKLQENMGAKYPCFSIKKIKTDTGLGYRISYKTSFFEKNNVSKFCSFYRPTDERCFTLNAGSWKSVDGDEQSSANDEETAPNTKKYGLDFVQRPGHFPVIETVYKRRIGSQISVTLNNDIGREEREGSAISEITVSSTGDDCSDETELRRRGEEYYPLNNPLLFTRYIQAHQKHPKLVKLANEEREMQVVENQLPQQKIDEYNKTFAEISERLKDEARKKKKGDAPDCAEEPTAVPGVGGLDPEGRGLDPEGRPIPTEAELFFPHGKNELYDVFMRFFCSDSGIRPGVLTADWKSQAMTDFVTQYHEYILENDLGALFGKQVHLIGFSTVGWNSDHYRKPLETYRGFRKQWRNKN